MNDLMMSVHLQHNAKEYLVGELAHSEQTILFEYNPEFLKTQIEISPFKLPLQSGTYRDPENVFAGLPGVFYDSLPDGWGLLLMDRYFRKHNLESFKVSPLERLAYIGTRGMGALTYEPATKLDTNIKHKLDLLLLASECERVLRGEDKEILQELIIAGGSPGGARPKVLVGFNQANHEICSSSDLLPDGFEPYIVKFASLTDYKDMGQVEYAYALMAKAAGINFPKNTVFEAKDFGYFFGVKRFDRDFNKRIHMHTLCGLLHADFRIPNCDYVDFLKATWMLTQNHEDVLEGYRRMVFNLYSHNRDDHSKNFSYLLTARGWRLSPAYDLTFSAGIAGEHTMTMAGEGANPQQQHLLHVAEKLEISSKTAKQIIEQVLDVINNWRQFAAQAGVSKRTSQDLRRTLKNIPKG